MAPLIWGFQPTYKELKPQIGLAIKNTPSRFQPTYKELKQRIFAAAA